MSSRRRGGMAKRKASAERVKRGARARAKTELQRLQSVARRKAKRRLASRERAKDVEQYKVISGSQTFSRWVEVDVKRIGALVGSSRVKPSKRRHPKIDPNRPWPNPNNEGRQE